MTVSSQSESILTFNMLSMPRGKLIHAPGLIEKGKQITITTDRRIKKCLILVLSSI